MKKSLGLLVLLLALPAYGQEQPAEEPPADTSSPPADQAPADAAPTDTVPVDAAPADASATPAESAPTEEAAATPAEPWKLYGGADWVRDTLSSSNLKGFGASNYDSGMYRLRLGARVFGAIGIEGHYGVKRTEDKLRTDTAETKQYYGLFLVPTASLFDTVELAFPVGYSKTSIEQNVGTGDASLASIGYGINAELPIRVFSASLPDIRFGAGWMVYYQKVNARLYGANVGLRYDFEVPAPGMGNPFSGMGDKVGGFFSGLWPFGKSEDKPAEAPAAEPPSESPAVETSPTEPPPDQPPPAQ